MFCLAGRPRANERRAETIVHPAEGPSLGVAPFIMNINDILLKIKENETPTSGTWRWTFADLKNLFSQPKNST